MLKNKIVNKLMGLAKHNKLLKPLMIFCVIIFLIVYHVIRRVYLNRRKIATLVFVLLFFSEACSVVLSGFIRPAAMERADSILLEGDDNTLVVEEVDMTTFSADVEDLQALARESEKKKSLSGTISNNNIGITINKNEVAIVYQDNGEYTDATFEEDWSLILVNKEHLIPEDYEMELGTVRGNIKCDIRILDNVLNMIKAARDEGVNISICSPYRDYDRQVMLFNRKAAGYIKKGYTEEEAYEMAAETVAIPGSSEHQLGLAFDFIADDYTTLTAGFANTRAGRWLKANAADYGFILRYPEDKTEETGIEFEPWHYRYVGKAAHEIMDNGLCLEEYVKQIGMME